MITAYSYIFSFLNYYVICCHAVGELMMSTANFVAIISTSVVATVITVLDVCGTMLEASGSYFFLEL